MRKERKDDCTKEYLTGISHQKGWASDSQYMQSTNYNFREGGPHRPYSGAT